MIGLFIGFDHPFYLSLRFDRYAVLKACPVSNLEHLSWKSQRTSTNVKAIAITPPIFSSLTILNFRRSDQQVYRLNSEYMRQLETRRASHIMRQISHYDTLYNEINAL